MRPNEEELHIPLLAASLLCLAFALFLLRGLAVSGILDGDEIAHYLHIRFLALDPSLVLDRWGRPLFTALYAPAAAINRQVVEVESAAMAMLACALTYAAARAARMSRAPLAIPLLALQPIFLDVSTACLPEVVFAVLMAAVLVFYLRNNDRAASIVVAVLPFVRIEGVVVMLLWTALHWSRGRRLGAIALWLPLLLWNTYWLCQPHPLPYYRAPDWLDLLYPFDAALRSGSGDYSQGSLIYYPRKLPLALGPGVFIGSPKFQVGGRGGFQPTGTRVRRV